VSAVILGYGKCRRCRELAPTAVLERSGLLCEGCIASGAMPHPSTRVVVGAKIIPLRRTIKIRGSKGSRGTRNASRRAHHAAAKRLRDCFPELYRLLYITERSNQGLDPVPLFATESLDKDALMRAIEAAGSRLEDEGLYDALRRDVEERCRSGE